LNQLFNDLPTVFFPYVRDSELLTTRFLKACIEGAFSPLVEDEKMDKLIFQSLYKLKISHDIVVLVVTENCVPRAMEANDFSEENKRPVLFFVQKNLVSNTGFLCVKLF
jgi:hypothetical protein